MTKCPTLLFNGKVQIVPGASEFNCLQTSCALLMSVCFLALGMCIYSVHIRHLGIMKVVASLHHDQH